MSRQLRGRKSNRDRVALGPDVTGNGIAFHGIGIGIGIWNVGSKVRRGPCFGEFVREVEGPGMEIEGIDCFAVRTKGGGGIEGLEDIKGTTAIRERDVVGIQEMDGLDQEIAFRLRGLDRDRRNVETEHLPSESGIALGEAEGRRIAGTIWTQKFLELRTTETDFDAEDGTWTTVHLKLFIVKGNEAGTLAVAEGDTFLVVVTANPSMTAGDLMEDLEEGTNRMGKLEVEG